MQLNSTFLKLNKIPLLLTVTSLTFYFSFAYNLERTDDTKLIMLYAGLFFLFYKLVQINKSNFNFLVAIAFIFRFAFLFAIPNLSQDFYRFIWDGRLILEGLNPYLHTPESFISKDVFPIAQSQALVNGMQALNASHFTNYPPINQLCFVIAGLFADKSILGSAMVLRLIIIAADFGTLYFGKKLLEKLNLPVHNIFWYILNPFIIIELTGNLHFEGVMIFFLVWSFYLLQQNKWKWAALVFGLSVSTKLFPLIFLPLFYQWFVKKENNKNTLANAKPLIGFYCIVGITTLMLFLPFYSKTFITNYSNTVALWFNKFEFNASLYYLARAYGYWDRGYNRIIFNGQLIIKTVILFVIIMAFFRKNKTFKQLIATMLLVFSFYLFVSTTVHPWYIAMVLFLSVFTNYKFPLVWSFAIIISYLAYANTNNTENLWVIALEYVLVYSVFIWEVFFKKKSLV